MGLGMAELETDSSGHTVYPVKFDNGTLSIYTTYNRLDARTHGWVLMKCEDGTPDVCEIDPDDDHRDSDHFDGIKAISSINNQLFNYNMGNVTATDVFYAVGYPYDDTAAEKFVKIDYRLDTDCDGDGNSDLAARCAEGTNVLCRGSVPLLDCVADMQSFGGYDYSGDIVYKPLADISDNDTFSMKRVVLYALVQEGQMDKGFNYGADNMTIPASFDLKDEDDEVTLNLPAGGRNYRWNVLTVDIKTYNVRY
jgi:hypothetical protein